MSDQNPASIPAAAPASAPAAPAKHRAAPREHPKEVYTDLKEAEKHKPKDPAMADFRLCTVVVPPLKAGTYYIWANQARFGRDNVMESLGVTAELDAKPVKPAAIAAAVNTLTADQQAEVLKGIPEERLEAILASYGFRKDPTPAPSKPAKGK